MNQIIQVVPASDGVGLTSVSLGLVRSLQRQGVIAGFIKPVATEVPDKSSRFAQKILHIDVATPLELADVINRIASNQTGEILEDLVGLCLKAASKVDALVIEGLHVAESHSLASQLNVDVARSLNADVVVVADASCGESFNDVRLSISHLRNAGCRICGVVFNKADSCFNRKQAQAVLGETRILGIVQHNPVFLAPRTLDVAQYLGARIVTIGELSSRRVLDTLVAARSTNELIPCLLPGTLVITSGDRDDIILAVALAASRGIELAGLLLTHNSAISPQVYELASLALNLGLPILQTADDSYQIARRISQLSTAVPCDDLSRMNTVLDAIAEDIDTELIAASFNLPESTRLSPPAFRYQLIQKARAANKRIVLPEGEEPRTVRAAVICAQKGIARCVLLGKRDIIENVAASQGIRLPDSLEIVDPDGIRQEYVEPMVELRKTKGLTSQQAVAQLEDSVVLGTMMLAVDDVDGLVSGAIHTTANTVRPALQLIKTAPGSSIVSSVFFMLMPDQVLVYGDCAINPAPDAEQLAEIAKQSADSAAAFGISPKVAMISYSTGNSGSGDEVEKVRKATEIAHDRYSELVLDGPLQYDAATVYEVGKQKAPQSKVAGQATVFVFPDLNTGNTTYKAVQRSANVVSVGPMLQGLRKPVNDLSRGALVEDIVFTIALTAIQANSMAT